MREYKFRGKRLDNGEWVYGYYCLLYTSHWRKKRDNATTDEDKLMAVCYVDAFRSVRVSVFGELLPLEEGDV